jgi:hypothetical protein
MNDNFGKKKCLKGMAGDPVEVLPHILCEKTATSYEKLRMIYAMPQSLKRHLPNVRFDRYHHADNFGCKKSTALSITTLMTC